MEYLKSSKKCCNGITTSAFFNESLFSGIFPTVLVLYLKDSELGEGGVLGLSL